MGYKIFTLSPGSTSTKLAVFDGEKHVSVVKATGKLKNLSANTLAKSCQNFIRNGI